jgi:hypothetical protein
MNEGDIVTFFGVTGIPMKLFSEAVQERKFYVAYPHAIQSVVYACNLGENSEPEFWEMECRLVRKLTRKEIEERNRTERP